MKRKLNQSEIQQEEEQKQFDELRNSSVVVTKVEKNRANESPFHPNCPPLQVKSCKKKLLKLMST